MTRSERFKRNVTNELMKSRCVNTKCGGMMTLRINKGHRSGGFVTPGVYETAEEAYLYDGGREFWYLECDTCHRHTFYTKETPKMQ